MGKRLSRQSLGYKFTEVPAEETEIPEEEPATQECDRCGQRVSVNERRCPKCYSIFGAAED